MESLPSSSNCIHRNKTNKSWNLMFYQILRSCKLENEFPPSSLPKSFRLNKSCAYIFHVDLEVVATKCLYLTMFKSLNKGHVTKVSYFIYLVIFRNPIWDIGFQQKLALQNNGRIYTTKLDKFIFESWHNHEQLKCLECF